MNQMKRTRTGLLCRFFAAVRCKDDVESPYRQSARITTWTKTIPKAGIELSGMQTAQRVAISRTEAPTSLKILESRSLYHCPPWPLKFTKLNKYASQNVQECGSNVAYHQSNAQSTTTSIHHIVSEYSVCEQHIHKSLRYRFRHCPFLL